MSEYKFVEFAGKKEYKCPKCKTTIRYAKYFGSDGKLLTVDGKEPFAGEVDGKFKSNTGWPTDPNTKTMHECDTKQQNIEMDQHQGKMETEVKRTDLIVPQARELDPNTFGMEARKKELLFECAILFKENQWITDYLISMGESNPNPQKVGLWHKMISERLARSHEPD